MEKLYSTPSILVDDSDGMETMEAVHVFQYSSDDEADDFGVLSHKEQLEMMGLKEEPTPSKGTVHRYSIDPGDLFVLVRETVMSWK